MPSEWEITISREGGSLAPTSWFRESGRDGVTDRAGKSPSQFLLASRVNGAVKGAPEQFREICDRT